MVYIDCAGDNEIAKQLEIYLKNLGFTAKTEESLVNVNEANVENILKHFLKETGRLYHSIRKIDSTNFLLSKEIPIEDFGFLRCEMCGYVVSSEEELLVHRRAHGIQLL